MGCRLGICGRLMIGRQCRYMWGIKRDVHIAVE